MEKYAWYEIAVIRPGRPAVGAFLSVGIEKFLMKQLWFASNPHGIVVQQIMQPESATGPSVSVGFLIQLDERAFKQVDQQFLGVQVVEVAGV